MKRVVVDEESPDVASLGGRRIGEAARRVEFLGLPLLVNAEVLEPREETELLAHVAIDTARGMGSAPSIVDMCCGSANLAIAVAARLPEARVWASDLTVPAVETARRNVRFHRMERRITVMQGDMFSAFESTGFAGSVDLIVCNPPYISSARLAGDRAHLLQNEPREAFDGGAYGISILQRLVREAVPVLAQGGILAFEFGVGQARQARLLLERSGGYEQIEIFCDQSGEERVARARRRPVETGT